jgi:cell wall-associated NlpC family hydrolase
VKRFFYFALIALVFSCTSSKNRSSTDPRIETAISTARSYTGTPYRYGGTSKRGMDCSGLLCVSYQSAGLSLPRTSAEQSKFGKSVNISELKPGDLVFFSKKRGRKKITHVGMVTTVKKRNDIRFIHSSTKLGVVENNLMSEYYRGIFVKARRPF